MIARRFSWSLLACAVAAFLAASVLLFANLGVQANASDFGDSAPGGEVGCSIAPWDAGLNGNDQGPGGEHTRAYFEEVGAECYAANMTRFKSAVALGALGTVLLGVALVSVIRARSTPE